MTDDTTTDRETVRPATECWLVHDGHWFATSMLRADEIVPGDGDVLALAIDNATGGGLVARVRAVVAEWCAGDLVHADTVPCYSCAPLVPRILAALGVQP